MNIRQWWCWTAVFAVFFIAGFVIITNKINVSFIERERTAASFGGLVYNPKGWAHWVAVYPEISSKRHIFYVRSARQWDSWSCFHWTICNAFAVQRLLNDGKQLQADALRAYTRGCMHAIHKQFKGDEPIPSGLEQIDIVQEDGTTESMRALADRWNIRNLYFLGYQGPEQLGVNYDNSGGDARQLLESLKSTFYKEYVWQDKTGALLFSCCVGNPRNFGLHGFLIAVVKEHGYRPYLLVLDSSPNNQNPEKDYDIYFVRYIDKIFFNQ